jgi:hypothetical protein
LCADADQQLCAGFLNGRTDTWFSSSFFME